MVAIRYAIWAKNKGGLAVELSGDFEIHDGGECAEISAARVRIKRLAEGYQVRAGGFDAVFLRIPFNEIALEGYARAVELADAVEIVTTADFDSAGDDYEEVLEIDSGSAFTLRWRTTFPAAWLGVGPLVEHMRETYNHHSKMGWDWSEFVIGQG